jgi:hypothetical protein
MKNLILVGALIFSSSLFSGAEVSARFGSDKLTGVPQPKAESVLEAQTVYDNLDTKALFNGVKVIKSIAGEFKCSRPIRGIAKYEGDCSLKINSGAVINSSLDSVVVVGDMAAQLYIAINKSKQTSEETMGQSVKKVANLTCVKTSGMTVSYKCKLSDVVVK